MNFLVITNVTHSLFDKKFWAYGPYVREMNLWGRNVSKFSVIAPLIEGTNLPIDLNYDSHSIEFYSVPSFDFVGIKNRGKAIYCIPIVICKMFLAMYRADHIHIRCPGNMGLLGCMLQVFFPFKKKSAKYAGNWDWNSKQPWSYRFQQKILRNTFLTRNIQVLVYGDWGESKNIKPFFTASYSEKEIMNIPPRKLELGKTIKLLFVGSLTEGKRPFLSLQVVERLLKFGISCELGFYGDGPELDKLMEYSKVCKIQEFVVFHGNVSANEVKQAYKDSHFLVFASQSEGWPKVIAESMFWGCLPITTAVSCVSEMVGNGVRGDLVQPNVDEITYRIMYYLEHLKEYREKCQSAMNWSRLYTLENLEIEIQNLLR